MHHYRHDEDYRSTSSKVCRCCFILFMTLVCIGIVIIPFAVALTRRHTAFMPGNITAGSQHSALQRPPRDPRGVGGASGLHAFADMIGGDIDVARAMTVNPDTAPRSSSPQPGLVPLTMTPVVSVTFAQLRELDARGVQIGKSEGHFFSRLDTLKYAFLSRQNTTEKNCVVYSSTVNNANPSSPVLTISACALKTDVCLDRTCSLPKLKGQLIISAELTQWAWYSGAEGTGQFVEMAININSSDDEAIFLAKAQNYPLTKTLNISSGASAELSRVANLDYEKMPLPTDPRISSTGQVIIRLGHFDRIASYEFSVNPGFKVAKKPVSNSRVRSLFGDIVAGVVSVVFWGFLASIFG